MTDRIVISQSTFDEIERVGNEWPDGIHTCAELQRLEPGRRPCTCGRCPDPGSAQEAVHFLYNASISGDDFWCAYSQRFGADKAAAAGHLTDATPGTRPDQDHVRRLLAEYRHYSEDPRDAGTVRPTRWMEEAADLLRRIAGES